MNWKKAILKVEKEELVKFVENILLEQEKILASQLVKELAKYEKANRSPLMERPIEVTKEVKLSSLLNK